MQLHFSVMFIIEINEFFVDFIETVNNKKHVVGFCCTSGIKYI